MPVIRCSRSSDLRLALVLVAACGSSARQTTLAPPDPDPLPPAPDLAKLPAQPVEELGVSPELLIYTLEDQPALAVAPDGKSIAIGLNDRAVHVLGLPGFTASRVIPAPGQGIIAGSVAFGPEDKLAVGWTPVGSKAAPIAAIYKNNGAGVATLEGTWVHAGQLIWLADRILVRGGKPGVWQVDGRGPILELELPFAKQLAVNAAGTHLVARERRPTYHARWDEHVRTTNQDPGKLYFARTDAPQIIKTVAFDAARVASAGDDFLAANHEWLRRYDREGRELAAVRLAEAPDAVVALGDRAIVGSRTAPLAIYRLSDLVPQRTAPITGVVALWPLPPDRLLVLDDKNHLRVVQLTSN